MPDRSKAVSSEVADIIADYARQVERPDRGPEGEPYYPQEWSFADPDPDAPGPGGGVGVREAQRYAGYLPPGVRLSEATRGQLAEAVRQGRAATPAVDPAIRVAVGRRQWELATREDRELAASAEAELHRRHGDMEAGD